MPSTAALRANVCGQYGSRFGQALLGLHLGRIGWIEHLATLGHRHHSRRTMPTMTFAWRPARCPANFGGSALATVYLPGESSKCRSGVPLRTPESPTRSIPTSWNTCVVRQWTSPNCPGRPESERNILSLGLEEAGIRGILRVCCPWMVYAHPERRDDSGKWAQSVQAPVGMDTLEGRQGSPNHPPPPGPRRRPGSRTH